jgi:riboflavin biosynthesis pyrimidine reductase
VEAGPGLAQGFLEADLVDAVSLYLSPKILGGRHGWTGGFQAPLAHAPGMERVELRSFGPDVCWRLRRAGIVERMEQEVREMS